jgi:hypothetical protein
VKVDDYERRKVYAPAAVWEQADRQARACGCSVSDLLLQAADRALSDPDYEQRISRLAASLFRPLSEWPADPIEYLLLAWVLNSRSVPDEQLTSFESAPDWWKQ